MFRLFSLIYALSGPTLAGVLIVAALTMNMFDTRSIIAAAVAGFVLGIPAAWLVARQISSNG
ncbi:hypothetical protein [Pontitalea aquivivens]|uniref:hypothetical protein n=1 Tax=Pontitalea aquivivens TaxID=3388663 RepID=UPI003970C2A5